MWRGHFDALEAANHESNRKVYVMPQVRTYVNTSEVESLQWNGIEIRNAVQSTLQMARLRSSGPNGEPNEVIDLQQEDLRSVVKNAKILQQAQGKKFEQDISITTPGDHSSDQTKAVESRGFNLIESRKNKVV